MNPKIASIKELAILDSRGNPALRVSLTLAARRPPPIHHRKKSARYLIATKRRQPVRIARMTRPGTYFCMRAPKYIPPAPPAPKRAPSNQSGATARGVAILKARHWKKIAPASEVMKVPIKAAPATV